MTPRRARWLLVLSALLLGGLAQPVHACSVPVFRYALERWRPDLYEVIVFHRGPLHGEPGQLVKRLEKSSIPGGGLAPFEALTVDVSKEIDAEMKELWQAQQGAAAPWLVLRMPRHGKRPEQTWAAPLNAATVAVLLDSPVRRAIANAIRSGVSGMWVLLECGDKARDDAAALVLTEQLRKLEKTLKLPVLRADNPEDRIERGPNMPELRLGFALIRLARTDPAEAALIQMLMRVEEDLLKYADRPLAVPVFGRGRALYGLVGPERNGEMSGINAETIEDACSFLIGPCGCEVKRLNPGCDLLIGVDWTNCPERLPMPFLVGGPEKTEDAVTGPEQLPMPLRIPVLDPLRLPGVAEDTPTDGAAVETSLLNIFLALIAGVAGTIAIALTMTRWRRI